MSEKTIRLEELLAVCVDLAQRACQVIRQVHQERVVGGDSVLAAELKDPNCDRTWATVADMKAQALIVALLRQEYPELEQYIVGEEDITLEAEKELLPSDPKEKDRLLGTEVSKSLPALHAAVAAPERHKVIPASTLSIFVDPVDGTKEFVEGRVENVCCLIGISIRGEAVAGVIGLPFWKEQGKSTDSDVVSFGGEGCFGDVDSVILSGIVDGPGGLGGLPQGAVLAREQRLQTRKNATRKVLGASAGGSPGSPVAEARNVLCNPEGGSLNYELVSIPACGNKVVRVVLGYCDAALMNTVGSLWDTCATEAILRACGGSMTDFFGGHFLHSKNNPMGMMNKYGALATAAGTEISTLWKKISATPAVTKLLEPSGLLSFPRSGEANGDHDGIAADIARTIEGEPFSTETLSKAICGDDSSKKKVVSYHSPDSSAVRYKMAECARLLLNYEDGAQNVPRSVFVKRSVMRDLTHCRAKITSAPHKLARDVRSYAVETAFLSSAAVSQLAAAPSSGNPASQSQITLARALFSQGNVDPTSLIDSSFLVLLEDFSNETWEQKNFLSFEELKATVASLAKYHAFFWNGRVGYDKPSAESETQKQLDSAVWDAGSYWSPKQQAHNQIENLTDRFEKQQYVQNFAPFVAARGGPNEEKLLSLREKLQTFARKAAKATHLYLEDDESGSTSFQNGSGAGVNSRTGGETQTDRSRSHPQRTLIHGDLKAANLFLKKKKKEDDQSVPEVGFIDFQWTGWGLGATDIAYLMCAGASPTALDLKSSEDSTSAENQILRCYYEALSEALVEFGAASSKEAVPSECQSFECLKSQYEVALIDHSVTVFSYLWNEFKASPTTLTERGKKYPLTANAVNKSSECAAWLLGRVSNLLEKHH